MAAKLSPGTVVAGFRVESSLGHGAMAEVYRACDESGQIVALKLLDDTLARDDRFRQRFLRESQLASGLEDPNIVRTIASGEDHGRLYLVMELVEGCDLRQLLRETGRFEPERAVALVEQVAGALDAAHGAGLVHRDVKPGNILVATAEDGEHAYVCDFGLARHVSSVSSLTGDRGFVGTIDYVPPEQIEGGTIDGRADVYSLGCVLYECLTGVRPYDRDSELSVVFAHLNEPPPKVTDVRAELPAAFDDVLATALAKSPDDRYSSCGELATAARAALHGEVLRRRRSHRRRFVVAAIAAGLLVVAAAAGFALTRKDHAAAPITITPTSLAGAKLGDSSPFLERLWGNGYQKLGMSFPPDYSVLTYRGREVSAYFVGTTDKAVEITTWNSAGRTAEGIGPCSTLAQLKKAYGARLKPSPNSHTPAGVPLGYSLGKHMYFALGPGTTPKVVEAIALFSNPLPNAGFNASNDGPCAPGVESIAVTRPKSTSLTSAAPVLRTTVASHAFVPRLTIRTPTGWSVRSNNAHAFSLASANGTLIGFWLDPFAATPDGALIPNVSETPNGLVRRLQQTETLVVSAPNTTLLGKPALTVSTIDVRARSKEVTYLAFLGRGYTFQLRAAPGRPTRLYLTSVRIGTLVHTLAFAIQSPSKAAFAAAQPAATAILSDLRVAAVPVLPLSPLSSFCTPVFYGTCVGELTAGTHTSTTFRPSVTYTVPLEWTNFTDHPGVFGLVPPAGDWQAIDSGQSDYVMAITNVTTAREGCADGHGTTRTPEGFVRWLRHEPGVALTNVAPVSIGGLSGTVVDIRMRKGWSKTCPWSHGVPAQQVITGLSPSPTGLNHGLLPGPMVMRLYLLNYRHGTLGIEVDEVSGDTKLPTYSAIVKTFRFAR